MACFVELAICNFLNIWSEMVLVRVFCFFLSLFISFNHIPNLGNPLRHVGHLNYETLIVNAGGWCALVSFEIKKKMCSSLRFSLSTFHLTFLHVYWWDKPNLVAIFHSLHLTALSLLPELLGVFGSID